MPLEDGVDERRERLDGGGDDQDGAEQTEEHRERDQPALAGVAAPQAVHEIGGRVRRRSKNDQAAPDSALSLDDHATSSRAAAGWTACLLTTVEPATSRS